MTAERLRELAEEIALVLVSRVTAYGAHTAEGEEKDGMIEEDVEGELEMMGELEGLRPNARGELVADVVAQVFEIAREVHGIDLESF